MEVPGLCLLFLLAGFSWGVALFYKPKESKYYFKLIEKSGSEMKGSTIPVITKLQEQVRLAKKRAQKLDV